MRPGGLGGLGVASCILLLWAIGLGCGLSATVDAVADLLWAVPLSVALTFLYTGLFITAHDAMHGTLAPGRPAWNTWVGTVCCFVYAFMSFDSLRRAHLAHHAAPGQAGSDPDFHDGVHRGPARWFIRFMKRYLTWRQLALLTAISWSLPVLFGVEWSSMLLFWMLPSMASTLQLFFVGTYLPHREGLDGPRNPHHARSLDLPVWASFLACYHFGYHLEHHVYPHLPWWRLPSARRQLRSIAEPGGEGSG